MVYIIRNLLMLISIYLCTTSCKEKVFTGNVNCDECFIDKSDSVNLTFHVTLNDTYFEVPFCLYMGKIEDGEFIDTFYVFVDEENILHNQVYVKAGIEYSAKAIYKTAERTVYVVDGTKQKYKRVSDNCEDVCWVSEDDDLFLELAY